VTDKDSLANVPARIRPFALRRVERRDCVNVRLQLSERPFPDVTALEAAPLCYLRALFANLFFEFAGEQRHGAVGTAALHILFGPRTEGRTVGKTRVFFFELREPFVVGYQRPTDRAKKFKDIPSARPSTNSAT
jgi:hypothetical protein